MQNNSINCDAKDATEVIPLTRCLDIVAQIATYFTTNLGSNSFYPEGEIVTRSELKFLFLLKFTLDNQNYLPKNQNMQF